MTSSGDENVYNNTIKKDNADSTVLVSAAAKLLVDSILVFFSHSTAEMNF
jgi:hypothetical protein